MWPSENDSTTLSVMRVFLKMEEKNPCQIEWMCVVEASRFLGVDECVIIK